MNNAHFLNSLKQKSIYVSGTGTGIGSGSTNRSGIISGDKYNPDVGDKYNLVSATREQRNYTYSTDIWKPIIGNVQKIDINESDFKVNLGSVNHEEIKQRYELVMLERNKEKEQIIQNNQNNSIEELKVDTNISNINNAFVELKNNSSKFNDSKNIDVNILMESMNKLDDLLNSIKDL